MRKIFSFILCAVFALTIVASANAAGSSSCQPIYGGGEVCEGITFTINKLVQKPGKGGGDFVENLNVNDPRYSPDQTVNFKIVVENTGKTEIKNLNVVDHFPQFLTFAGGVGNSNIGASQISFVIGSLGAGQKAEYTLSAKFAKEADLPNNQAVTCVVNNVSATASDGATASDNAQVCVEKKILGATPTPEILAKPMVKSIPATGPETSILFGLIPAGLAGFYLRKKA